MAASTKGGNAALSDGVSTYTGKWASVITASETNQLKAKAGKIGHIAVWDAGTAWVIDVYDDPDSNDSAVWQWVTADGKGIFALQMPMQTGIRIVTSGTTAGSATVVWE